MSVLLAVLTLSCADDPAERAAPTTPPAVTTTSPSPSASPTPSIAVEPDFAHFSTPTKNIGCYLTTDGASCEISQRDWALPSRPADCDLDWGPGIAVGSDGVVEVGQCRSDTAMGAERILAYGTGVEVGAFRCTSATDGITCRHVPSGKGFFLSRAAYRILP